MKADERKFATRKTREAVCMYRKISGEGCNRCPFCGEETLCVRPARFQPAIPIHKEEVTQ